MASTKTTTERIDTLQEKISQLENEKKRLLNLQKQADRKARTKRLIERGAILESLISGADTFTNDQIKAFLEKTIATEPARKILDGLVVQGKEAADEKSQWRVNSGTTAVAEKVAVTEQDGEQRSIPLVY